MKSPERFLSLPKHDILKLDLAVLNFGVYLVTANPFFATAAREPAQTRETLRARGILIQGESLSDIHEILNDLRAVTAASSLSDLSVQQAAKSKTG